MATKNNDQNDNTGTQLQEMMFAQMKRLSDDTLDMEKEIKRAQALSAAGTIIINAQKVKIDQARVTLMHQKHNGKPTKQLNNG